jgi:transcriptional/translational regulatory protein YebC/TACO1
VFRIKESDRETACITDITDQHSGSEQNEPVQLIGLEAGAEDVVSEEGGFTVKCQPGDFTAVLEAIKAGGIAVDEENSSIGLVPNMMNPVSDVATAKAINKFVDMLEDLEDVQDVYTNMETTDEVDAALEAEG